MTAQILSIAVKENNAAFDRCFCRNEPTVQFCFIVAAVEKDIAVFQFVALWGLIGLGIGVVKKAVRT